MIKHTENIARVDGVRSVLNAAGTFYIFEMDVTTAGGIHKTLRIPQFAAAFALGGLKGEFEELAEKHTRDEGNRMFYASAGRPELAN